MPKVSNCYFGRTPCSRAYVLADNKLALNAGWDLEMLSLRLRGELRQRRFFAVLRSPIFFSRRIAC